MRSKGKNMVPAIIVGLVIVALLIAVFNNQSRDIKRWADANGYVLISADLTVIDHGPFSWYEIPKNASIYKIVVERNKLRKVFYAKFAFGMEVREYND